MAVIGIWLVREAEIIKEMNRIREEERIKDRAWSNSTRSGQGEKKRKEPAAESEAISVMEENQESRMSWPSGEESASTGRYTAVGPVLCQVGRKEG